MTDREILRELLEAFDAPFPAANFGMTAHQEWAMRIESAKKTGFAAIAATQPVKQHSDYHRTLAKWLNEETTAPIDRVALAHVLGAAAQAPPVIAPALAAPQPAKPEPQASAEVIDNGFGGRMVATLQTELPPVGTKLYTTPQPARMLTEAEIFKTLTTQCMNLTEACDLLQRKFCEVNGIPLTEQQA